MPRAVPLGGSLWRWLRGETGSPAHRAASGVQEPLSNLDHQAPWWKTLWLTGVDYFSTLGYAPGIAFLAAGYVAPLAMLILVIVTFAAAVPTYAFVAKHSSHGEGSIKMIERLTTKWGRMGWYGKTLVLMLLGFAMTDFVITITLSAADATLHIIENPFWPEDFPRDRVLISQVLVAMLCLVFLKGFREAIGLAVLIAAPYMLLNVVLIGYGLVHISQHPELVADWWTKLGSFSARELREFLNAIDPVHALDPVNWMQGHGIGMLIVVSLIVFPKLALGMSGFETGVAVMPQITAANERDRIKNTRRLLVTAATLMTTALMGSTFVTTVLIPSEEFAVGGKANGRALAYLAHEHLGELFGTVYDFYTVAILWFAGASAMAGLLNIIPRYLPRFGMSPDWLEYRRPLVLVITTVCFLVTWIFHADVDAQGGAYATGVLVLMSSGALAVLLAEWENRALRTAFVLVLTMFVYVLVVNVIERPDGLRIAATFIVAMIAASIWSRWRRVSELRVQGFAFTDPESERLWKELQATPDLVVIPLRSCDRDSRHAAPARSILHLEVEKRTTPCFLHVELTEDPSNFTSPIRVKVRRDANDVVIEVSNAVAVANAIAYVALELHADEVVIGLLESGTPVVNALMYLFFGTGEVGYGVRSIFMRVREERLALELRQRRAFDRERDEKEQEVLREMLDAPANQREELTKKLFAEEAEAFKKILPKTDKLPRLILLG
jgi:hypothetical protein